MGGVRMLGNFPASFGAAAAGRITKNCIREMVSLTISSPRLSFNHHSASLSFATQTPLNYHFQHIISAPAPVLITAPTLV